MVKFLVFALIMTLVWGMWRFIARVERVRLAQQQRRATAARTRTPAAAEDMTRCPACGVWVAARGASACGQADCPYRRH